MKLLDGMLVLDFAQFLAGPWAAEKLSDLGARVIKVERPNGGDNSRQLCLKDIKIDGDSTVFHSMNRGKESYAANLKDPEDLARVKKLIEKADVIIENFRPGIMDRIGIGYEQVKEINPSIIYASVTGYGSDGPLVKKPGQDLLVQSLVGIPYLNGDAGNNPVPIGHPAVDICTAMTVVQGVLAAYINRMKTGEGSRLEFSLLECGIDFEFEAVTAFLNDDNQNQARSSINNAHPYLDAPYGIYKTADDYISISMGYLPHLGELIGCDELLKYESKDGIFEKRDEIKEIIANHLLTDTTEKWLSILEPADYWCSKVNTLEDLFADEKLMHCDMVQELETKKGSKVKLTRFPMRLNGEKAFNYQRAPALGEHTDGINNEFDL